MHERNSTEKLSNPFARADGEMQLKAAAAPGAAFPRRPHRAARALEALVLLLVLGFFALHFVHLSADFPNFSRWMDWSKYTDEGWYGDAAIRHFQLGHWYVPGDFNPAVALPVWPFLEAILFRFTGVSLVAARALTVGIFGGILLASWLLIQRSGAKRLSFSLTASVAVLLLAANPFCYVFTRLAILEPMLILLMLLALLAAQSVDATRYSASSGSVNLILHNAGPILALGLLLPLIILTKTTGLFLVPAVAWLLFASVEYRLRPFVQVGLTAAGLAACLWLAYFLLLVRPHYLLDYRYLFSANAYTKITRSTFFTVLLNTVKDGRWFGSILFPVAMACTVVALANVRRLRSRPLIPTLVLWAGGYAAFLAYHNNLQPRYYLVVAVPLTLLIPVTFRDLILPRLHRPMSANVGAAAAIGLVTLIVVFDAVTTLDIVRHPQYTLLSAARQVASYIAHDQQAHPGHSGLVLSISGSDLSLMTGVRSICDDFGTAELADRVKQYNPGWYAAWDLIEDDKMDALSPLFRVQRVATYPAMDDPDRNLLVLYRLEPANSDDGQSSRRRRRSLRNKIGQEPSVIQTKH